MNKKVNWGIIGLGNAAMNFAKASQLTENAILKGISSKNQKKIYNFKELFDVKSEYCFDNYEDLINCSEIEAIYIALPNSMHYDFIIKCIEAKKKFLVEKQSVSQNLWKKIITLPSSPDLNKIPISLEILLASDKTLSNWAWVVFRFSSEAMTSSTMRSAFLKFRLANPTNTVSLFSLMY